MSISSEWQILVISIVFHAANRLGRLRIGGPATWPFADRWAIHMENRRAAAQVISFGSRREPKEMTWAAAIEYY